MVDLSNLSPQIGSTKQRKRLGRGPGTGHGKTAGRGHKGFKARSGSGVKPGFEGGQMPLQRRVPKFGFKNINRVEYKAINIDSLQKLAEAQGLSVITLDTFVEAGFISSSQLVKILGKGALTAKLDVTANAFSASAIKAIEAVGGSVTTC